MTRLRGHKSETISLLWPRSQIWNKNHPDDVIFILRWIIDRQRMYASLYTVSLDILGGYTILEHYVREYEALFHNNLRKCKISNIIVNICSAFYGYPNIPNLLCPPQMQTNKKTYIQMYLFSTNYFWNWF